jgi:2-hydroxycyclohexanecarboxyl-CoA dehydrogenase
VEGWTWKSSGVGTVEGYIPLVDLGLKDKSVVVTGGASNIGRGITLAFAAEGAHVRLADIDRDQAERVASEAGERVVSHQTDVTDPESVQAMVDSVDEENGQIDVLVNCAGWTVDRLFMEKPRDEWQKEVAINQWGFINCTRAVLPGMIERSSGRIVSIGSDAGRMGEYREAVYAGTKAAIIAMSKAIAREVGRHGITLNVVCPGFTPPSSDDTGSASMWAGELGRMFPPEMQEKIASAYPLRRLGTPADIAAAVLFLASEPAAYITGQTLSVSGGYTMA